MTTSEIRRQFFRFFESKGHRIVPSAPMVVKNDPTLMFTNAGMNPFKDYFLGYAEAKDKRVANTQKCLRVSGKHNDLEEVGVDTYHHTMFEMLGNWSFGDYFKEEAIGWAWELLTEVYGIPKEKLYVTIFGGDEQDGVPADEESIEIWKKHIDSDRIIPCSKKDNFWEMGETGPCGPCTEIHIDLRSVNQRKTVDGKTLVNQDHPQVIEIWNLVFMQFNRKANGSLENLPATHVDTGMGLERLAMALQGKTSNYDTDIFQDLIGFMEKQSGVTYGSKESTDIALRVIADHVRAIAFSIADGQLPSNTGAGYVIRRILRRAVRYGYQTLGLKEPFLCDLCAVLSQSMGETFPELTQQNELIRKVMKEEEQSFFRTLEQGIRRIETIINKCREENATILSGSIVFELYDTFGFPVDLTSLIARENGLSIDEEGFQLELEKQKERSRAATASETQDWIQVHPDTVTHFIGYDHLQGKVRIIKYRKVTQKQRTFYQMVLDPTPFYAEGGGQVGDKGWIQHARERIEIFDTKKENNLIVHLCETLPNEPQMVFDAFVDEENRRRSAANHSGTHLLHFALRTVLGKHVEQKGSLVNAHHMRFDFSHFAKVSEEELQMIEELVIRMIQSNIELDEYRELEMSDALDMGAMALFGEKYGERVRVIRFGDSVELCGGTHVRQTRDIGLFKILSESAVASGVRRIEAITSYVAERHFRAQSHLLSEINTLLKKPKDVVKSVEDLIHKNHALSKEIEQLQKEKVSHLKAELKTKITEYAGMYVLFEILPLEGGLIKDLLFQLRGEIPNFFGVIGGSESADKCTLSIMASESVVETKGIHSGQLIKKVSSYIEGGGGGQAFFATAGGKKTSGLEKALAEIKESL